MSTLMLVKQKHGEYYGDINYLWGRNHPRSFWQVISSDVELPWQLAISRAIENIMITKNTNIENFLSQTLGEGRFGNSHWNLSTVNRIYWWMKPIIPGVVTKELRSMINRAKILMNKANWPIDGRYIQFLWETMRQAMLLTGQKQIYIKEFWPEGKEFAFVLTHDIETPEGKAIIPQIMDLEESLGFRSSFNFVGDQITDDHQILDEISARGFEVGLHGWHHDASTFMSQDNFRANAIKMNEKIKALGIKGHRSPLNLRNPEWMQELDIEYDLSFFDTDPFEPIPGGAMSIWPFFIGRFVEIPATLVQDNTLINFLKAKTPDIWEKKTSYIQEYHGMALLNSHPEYLRKEEVWQVYANYLRHMANRTNIWNAIPSKVTDWWRYRTNETNAFNGRTVLVELVNDQVRIRGNEYGSLFSEMTNNSKGTSSPLRPADSKAVD